MNQALHILKKDARYLRVEIAFLTLTSFLYAGVATRQSRIIEFGWVAELVLFALTVVTLSQAVHAETIPGDTQFWLTRPYRWQSLLASKLLFIVFFVNLPVLLARIAITWIEGIPLLPAIPGLLWTQLWLLLLFAVPAAALAAVTRGFVPFILLTMAAVAMTSAMFSGVRSQNPWPYELDWIRTLPAIVAAALICGGVLLMQYKGRYTRGSRIKGAGALALVFVLYRFTPLAFALEAQTWLGSNPPEAATVQVEVRPSAWIRTEPNHHEQVLVHFDPIVRGVPEGIDFRIDGLSVSLNAADGQEWRSGRIAMDVLSTEGNPDRSATPLDESFFQAERGKPLQLSADIYLTLFGKPREKAIPVINRQMRRPPYLMPTDFMNVLDDLQCDAWATVFPNQRVVFLRCESISALSSSLVYPRTPDKGRALRSALSYAPVPLATIVEPRRLDAVSFKSEQDEVTVVVKQRLGHIRRKIQLGNIRLDDLLSPAK